MRELPNGTMRITAYYVDSYRKNSYKMQYDEFMNKKPHFVSEERILWQQDVVKKPSQILFPLGNDIAKIAFFSFHQFFLKK